MGARRPTAGAGPDPPDEDGSRAPAGEVLGPLPSWAAVAVVAALLGEVAGEHLAGGPTGWPGGRAPADGSSGRVGLLLVGAGIAAAAGGLVALLRRARRSDPPGWRWATVGAAALFAVVLVGSAARVISLQPGLLPHLAQHGGEARLEAVVVHEPRPIATGWSVIVRVVAVDGTGTRERAALTLDEGTAPPPLGSRWEVAATARPLPDGGYGRWLARQHASVLLDVRRWDAAGAPGWAAAASEHVRARIRDAATRHLDARLAGLLVGFVTGDTRLLLNDDAEAMRATSLTHLTAVSGANLAIVIGGVLLVLHALRVGPRWRRRLVAATVVAFAFLTRFEPSVLRAGSMALLVLLVAARGMPRDARHALAGAVLLLVLLDPRLAGSLGLLLSATATAGVLVVAPVVERRLGRVPRRLRTVVAITIGAQVTVVPLLLTTFGEVPLASVPANVVAVPAAALAAVLSFLGSVLALVHLELGAPLFWLAGLPARVVLGAAHGFAGLGGAATLARPTTVVALVGVCAWVLTPPRSRRSRRVGAVALVALLASGVTPLLGGLPPRQLTVTAIDVGQGDAFLIESPGARILVDAGADDTAARWLRSHGRRRLDLVVVSHPHLDHVGGVPAVLRRLRVDAVWYRPLPTPLPEAAEVLAVAAERGIAVRSPVTGDRARVGDLVVEVLHPPPGRPYRWSRSELNDTSLVLRISHGDRRVLTTGDVEVVAQRDLLASAPGRLQAELVTTPHHGADTSDPAFLTALDPLVALISAGRDNPHGHPAPATIAHLDRQGVVVRRTDLEGTIRVAVPSRPAAGGVPSPPRHATVPRRLGHGEPGRHRSPGAIAPPGHRTSEGHRCPSS